MAKIFLTQPDARYRDTFLKGCRALNERGETQGAPDDDGYTPDPLIHFDDYLQLLLNHAKGQGLPEHYVPYTNYWLIDGDTFVARGTFRHTLNDFLLNYGGHVGYAVVPEHRQKGYGKKLLELMLVEAAKMGVTKVLVCCRQSNQASAKTIEANGGVFENLVDDKISNTPGEKIRRYWIG